MDLSASFQAWLSSVTDQTNQVERANINLQQSIDQLTQTNSDNQTQVQALQGTIKDQADIIATLNNSSKQKQYYGIVGHFYDSPIYKDVQKFIDNGNSLGMNCTRTSPPLNSSGIMVNETDFFSRVYVPLKLAGWEIFPLMDTEGLSTTDDGSQYQKGFNVASGFVKRYGKLFQYVELGNELSLKALLPKKDGRKVEDYDPDKLKSICQYLKGCYDGIKSIDVNYKIAINGEWVHYGFIDAVLAYGVNFDILTWHFYVGSPNQESTLAGQAWNGKGQLIEEILEAKYPNIQKVFNEVGFASPKLPFDEDKQALQLPPLVNRLRSKGYTVLIYQMYDQSEKGVLEGNYGIFKADGTPKKVVALLK